jgi:tetratricopeptide (TPR) repeat protein
MRIRRILFVAASMIAIGGLSAVTTPALVAHADDLSMGLDDYGAPLPAPVMPDLTAATQAVASPQPVTALSALPGSNPFQAAATASVVPAGVAQASTNPFALPGVAGAVAQPDAAPFGLLPVAPGTVPDAVAPAAPQPGDSVDVTALRYYANQRDMARVGAEIRRLKALYPDWEPPTDLFVAPSTVNEQPLWDLFAEGEYTLERARIAELKTLNPTWTPSTDLMTKLGDAEAHQAMKVAYNVGNWEQVIAVAQGRSGILVCSQIEALWQLGEALAHVGNYALSFEVYKYVLTNCNDADQRLATMQKAAQVMPLPGIRALVLLGRPLPDGTSEFDSIAFNDLRHRLNAAINESFNAVPVDPSEMERFAVYVRTTRNPDDIGIIGWYYFSLDEWDAARAWFSFGGRYSRDPKFIEGQLLALRSAGNLEAALKLGEATKNRSPELTKEYIELVSAILTDPDAETEFTDRQLEAFEGVVRKAKSALGAQAIGWTYIADKELADASDWFDTSVEWEVTEGGVIGQAVVASRLKHYKTLSTIKANYGEDYRDLAKFKVYTVKAKSKKKVTKATLDCKDARGLLSLFVCPRR